MSKQVPQTSHPPAEDLLEIGTSAAYQYLGIFASRMCLVLERFLCINDYRIPATRPLNEAIAFFKKAKHEISTRAPKKPSQVISSSELVSQYLKARKEKLSGEEFCALAIATLEKLLAEHREVSP